MFFQSKKNQVSLLVHSHEGNQAKVHHAFLSRKSKKHATNEDKTEHLISCCSPSRKKGSNAKNNLESLIKDPRGSNKWGPAALVVVRRWDRTTHEPNLNPEVNHPAAASRLAWISLTFFPFHRCSSSKLPTDSEPVDKSRKLTLRSLHGPHEHSHVTLLLEIRWERRSLTLPGLLINLASAHLNEQNETFILSCRAPTYSRKSL